MSFTFTLVGNLQGASGSNGISNLVDTDPTVPPTDPTITDHRVYVATTGHVWEWVPDASNPSGGAWADKGGLPFNSLSGLSVTNPPPNDGDVLLWDDSTQTWKSSAPLPDKSTHAGDVLAVTSDEKRVEWVPATTTPAVSELKAPVPNAAALPTTGNTNGDMRITLNDGHVHVWIDPVAPATIGTWTNIGPAMASGAAPLILRSGTPPNVVNVLPKPTHATASTPAQWMASMKVEFPTSGIYVYDSAIVYVSIWGTTSLAARLVNADLTNEMVVNANNGNWHIQTDTQHVSGNGLNGSWGMAYGTASSEMTADTLRFLPDTTTPPKVGDVLTAKDVKGAAEWKPAGAPLILHPGEKVPVEISNASQSMRNRTASEWVEAVKALYGVSGVYATHVYDNGMLIVSVDAPGTTVKVAFYRDYGSTVLSVSPTGWTAADHGNRYSSSIGKDINVKPWGVFSSENSTTIGPEGAFSIGNTGSLGDVLAVVGPNERATWRSVAPTFDATGQVKPYTANQRVYQAGQLVTHGNDLWMAKTAIIAPATAGDPVPAPVEGPLWTQMGGGASHSYAADITLVANTAFSVAHGLKTEDVTVAVYTKPVAPALKKQVDAVVEIVDADNIHVTSSVGGDFRIVVKG